MPDQTATYAILVYDVDSTSKNFHTCYAALRTRIGKLALAYTQSCYLIRLAQANKLHDEIAGLIEKYGVDIDYRIRKLDASEGETLRQDAVHALIKQIKAVSKALVRKVDKLRKKLDAQEIEAPSFDRAKKVAYKRADKELRRAKGLALMFQIEQDAQNALDSLRATLKAEGIMEEDLLAATTKKK